MPHAIKAADNNDTIYIYDPIASNDFWGFSISAKDVIVAIESIGQVPTLNVRINSPGGEVFEGDAIYNALRRKSASGTQIVIHIDGLAASAAAFIAMAGDSIEIAENAFFMLHEAWTFAMGNKGEIAKTIDLLAKIDEVQAKIFAARSGKDVAIVTEWLLAETWFGAQEAVDNKLADKIGTSLHAGVTDATAKMAARWHKTPQKLAASIAAHAQQVKKELAKSPTPRLAALKRRTGGK